MITNTEILKKFETELLKSRSIDHAKNIKLVEALYEEAHLLGVWPPDDPLEGIQLKIRIARVLNGVH
jgi:hypothetical protein